LMGFSTKNYWIFSFQESSAYTHSTLNVTNVLSVKTMDFDGDSWHFCHDLMNSSSGFNLRKTS
jgi:hypothetical protein